MITTNRREALNVQLEQFEGPLALLLYLIRKEEMDIYNIQIHVITKQYLEYIQSMKKLDLEVASEFITMAATLIHIKSRVLLPQYDEQGEEVIEDPRKELVQRLVEYKKFQDFSKKLNQRPILGRDTWRRGFKEDIVLEENQEVELEDSGLFGMIAAYRNIVKAAQKRIHKVAQKGQSIASRILEIKDLLVPGKQTVMLSLIRPEEMTKNKLLVTFLSMLELGKMGFVRIFQSEPYSDIYVEPLKLIDGDVINRVEAYDGANAETAALKLIEKSENRVLSEAEAKEAIQEVIEHTGSDQVAFSFEDSYKSEVVEEVSPVEETASDEDILLAEAELGIVSAQGVEELAHILEKKEETIAEVKASLEDSSAELINDYSEIKKDYEPEL